MSDGTDANVINAVATVRRLAVEVDAMLSEVERALLASTSPFSMTSGGVETLWSTDEVAVDGWALTLEVRERKGGRGRPTRLGELSFTVDVGREGGPAEAAGRPCILVAWTISGDKWGPTIAEGDFWPVKREQYDIVDGRLLLWRQPEGEEETTDLVRRAWFHIVPLYAVTGAEDVGRLLLRPFSRLLRGDQPDSVFAHPEASMRVAWRADGTLAFTPHVGERST